MRPPRSESRDRGDDLNAEHAEHAETFSEDQQREEELCGPGERRVETISATSACSARVGAEGARDRGDDLNAEHAEHAETFSEDQEHEEELCGPGELRV